MIGIIPEYFDWVVPGVELNERWEFREFQEYPPGDASDETIEDFIEDAKKAEKAIEKQYLDSGVADDMARKLSCQWPLDDDAPMDIIRNFIGYQYNLQESLKAGIDP